MFGNTIFYPGMELYINPYGIGGTVMGAPNKADSIANKLGFGGYHTIIGVNSSIAPGKFSTTVRAQWYYSGDGRGPADSNGEEDTSLSRFDPERLDPLAKNADNDSGGFCSNAVIEMENDLMRLSEGDPTGFSIGDVDPTSMGTSSTAGDPLDAVTLTSAPKEDIPDAASLGTVTTEQQLAAKQREREETMAEQRSQSLYGDGGVDPYVNAKLWQDSRQYLEQEHIADEWRPSEAVEMTSRGLMIDEKVVNSNVIVYENVGNYGAENPSAEGTPKFNVIIQDTNGNSRETDMDSTELAFLLQDTESNKSITVYEVGELGR